MEVLEWLHIYVHVYVKVCTCYGLITTSYIQLPICTLSEKKQTCSALGYLTDKVKNIFFYLFVQVFFSDRVCSLGVYVENCK